MIAVPWPLVPGCGPELRDAMPLSCELIVAPMAVLASLVFAGALILMCCMALYEAVRAVVKWRRSR